MPSLLSVSGRLTSAQRTTVALGGAATAVVAIANPNTTHVPLCPLHAMTGLWCPFCGSLRAVFELTRGRIGLALHDNVILVAALPLLLVVWLDAVRRQNREQPARHWPRVVWLVAVAVVFLFAIVRNLPGGEFLHPSGQ
jgi:hypothetical protein